MWGLLLLTTQRLCSGVSLAFVNTRAAEMLYNKQRVKRHHTVKSGRKRTESELEGELTFTGVNAIDTAGTC